MQVRGRANFVSDDDSDREHQFYLCGRLISCGADRLGYFSTVNRIKPEPTTCPHGLTTEYQVMAAAPKSAGTSQVRTLSLTQRVGVAELVYATADNTCQHTVTEL